MGRQGGHQLSPTPTTGGLEPQCGGEARLTVPPALLWMWAVSTCLGLAAHEDPRCAGCFVVRTPHAALPCPPRSWAVPTLSWSVWGSLGRQPGPGVPAGLLGYKVMVTGQAGQAQLGSQPCGQCPRRVSGVAQGKWPEVWLRPARLCLQVRGGWSELDTAPWARLPGGVRAWGSGTAFPG